jgi:hypothetical protein
MTVRTMTALICAASVATACSSTTVIRSNPSGARVFIDNSYVGTTPYTLSDSKIAGSSTSIRLEYPGRAPQMILASKGELRIGPLIAGLFFLVPLLWVTGYKNEYTVELAAPDPNNPYAHGAPQMGVGVPQMGVPQMGAQEPGAQTRAVEMNQVDQGAD